MGVEIQVGLTQPVIVNNLKLKLISPNRRFLFGLNIPLFYYSMYRSASRTILVSRRCHSKKRKSFPRATLMKTVYIVTLSRAFQLLCLFRSSLSIWMVFPLSLRFLEWTPACEFHHQGITKAASLIDQENVIFVIFASTQLFRKRHSLASASWFIVVVR